MKICITLNGKTVESMLELRFGRCSYFVVANFESGEHTVILNETGIFGSGAGISLGQLMVKKC